MPYREPAGFSWQTINRYAHARRVVAAMVLVMAGWATGFFAGRMSAWLFPVIGTDTAAVTSVLDRSSSRAAAAAQTNAGPPTPHLADEKQKTAAAPAPAPDIVQPERNPPKEPPSTAPGHAVGNAALNVPAAPNVDRKVEAPTQEEAKSNRGAVVLVNPDWTRAGPIPRQREPEERPIPRQRDLEEEREGLYDEAGFAECESRYSSFRRRDGTYQPYGRSSRELCPYLR